jgi:hypothetical protein
LVLLLGEQDFPDLTGHGVFAQGVRIGERALGSCGLSQFCLPA